MSSSSNDGGSTRIVDNKANDVFNLCVDGIKKLITECCKKPNSTDATEQSAEIECYLWVDYSSMMQLELIKEDASILDTVISYCDVIFTPLLERSTSSRRKKSLTYGQPKSRSNSEDVDILSTYTSGESMSGSLDTSNLLDTHMFNELCNEYAWKEKTQGYLSRAWCRLEMFLGAYLPYFDGIEASVILSEELSKKMKLLDEESAVGQSVHCRRRVHVLCHRKKDARTRSNTNEVFSPIYEVSDNIDIDDMDVVVFAGDAASLTQRNDCSLVYLPKPTPMHFAYYNPVDGIVSKIDDKEIISTLTNKLKSIQDFASAQVASSHSTDLSIEVSSEEAHDRSTREPVYVENTAIIFANGDTYVGSTKNGFLHGKNGHMNYYNGNKYTGDFVNNVKSGVGLLELVCVAESSRINATRDSTLQPVLGTYDGCFQDDYMWGEGTFSFPDGSFYKGQFELDKFNGYGKLEYANGDSYSGNFRNNHRSGEGIMRYANGEHYTGFFLNDYKHGHGVMGYINGDVYAGSFQHDKRWGEGEYVYSNGDVYKGQFEGNKRNGFGVYTHIDSGEVYSGQWENSVPSGQGVYIYASGDTFSGKWLDGKRPSTGVYTCKNGDVYTGSFQKGKRSGHGSIVYHTGITYEGNSF